MTNVSKLTNSAFIFVLSLGLSVFANTTVFGQTAGATKKPATKTTTKAATKTPTSAVAKPASDKPLPYVFHGLEGDMDKFHTQLSSIYKNGSFNGNEKELFQKYCQTYYFARWIDNGQSYQIETHRRNSITSVQTNTSVKKTSQKNSEDPTDNWNYPAFIKDFRDKLDKSPDGCEFQKELVKIAYTFATDVIESDNVNCTNAAKFNCMLLLGNMYFKVAQPSSTPAKEGAQSSSVSVKAVAPAFKYLLTSISNENTPCYLRIGAIQGLCLMLEDATFDDTQKKTVYETLFPILNTKIDVKKYANSKEDPTGAGAIWLRERAIVALGLLAGPKQNKSATGFYPPKDIIKALFSIIKDDSAPITTRTIAVESLGSYNFSKYSDLKAKLPPALLKVVAQFVVNGIQTEIDRQSAPLIWGNQVDEYNHGAHDADSTVSHDDTSDAVFLLQRTLPYLFATRTALNGVNGKDGWDGLSGFGSENDKEIVREVIKNIRKISKVEKALNSSASTDSTMESDEDATISSKKQDVVVALEEIQSVFQQYAE